ncbi:hypothetical protein FDP41_000715 [Naegleria fowleri]|uniref:Uncharacterized protein n=1 Tax=Naegleria fowleri TaxID=5763 RepID=A0A6A5CAN6_NAEFO|nr:uncharacterized protein FDP41_000715 [Naegleria fowleri]KAF0984816.1 hypothetical protein FDP41_000715 [Naegleria fowleri]CAG4719181.1 unnamed protein product [Naegleria fowleri]
MSLSTSSSSIEPNDDNNHKYGTSLPHRNEETNLTMMVSHQDVQVKPIQISLPSSSSSSSSFGCIEELDLRDAENNTTSNSRYTLCDLPNEIFDVIFFFLLPSAEERKERCFNDLFSFLRVNRTIRSKLKNNGYFWGSVFARFQVFMSCYLMDLPLFLPCDEKYSNFSNDEKILEEESDLENTNDNNKFYYYSIHELAAKQYIDWLYTFCDPSLIRKLEVPLPVDGNPQQVMNLWQNHLSNITHFLTFPVMDFPNDKYLQACNFKFHSLTHLDVFDGYVDISSIISNHPGLKSVTLDVPSENTSQRLKSFAEICTNQLPNLKKVQLCVLHLQLDDDEIYTALLSLAPKLKQINIYINSEEDISRWNTIAQNTQCMTHLYVRTAMNLQLVNDLLAKKYREEYCLFVVPSTLKQLGVHDQINIGSFYEEVPVSVCLNGINLPSLTHFDLQVSCLIGDNQLPFPKLQALYFDSYGNAKMPTVSLFEFWANQHETLRSLLFNIISKPEEPLVDVSMEKTSIQSPTIVLKKKPLQMKSVNITIEDFELIIEDCPRNLTVGNVTKNVSITGSNYVNAVSLNMGSHLESHDIYVNIKNCDTLRTSPPLNNVTKATQLIHGHYNSIIIGSFGGNLALLPHIQIMDMTDLVNLSFNYSGIFSENEYDLANVIREFLSRFSSIACLKATSEQRTCEFFNVRRETLNEEVCKQMFLATTIGKENKLVTQISRFRTDSDIMRLPNLSSLKITAGSPLILDRITLSHLKILDISHCQLSVEDASVVDLHWIPFLKHAIFVGIHSVDIICSDEQEHHYLKYLYISQTNKLNAKISLRGPNLRVVCVTKTELQENSFIRIVHAPKLVLSVLHIPNEHK